MNIKYQLISIEHRLISIKLLPGVCGYGLNSSSTETPTTRSSLVRRRPLLTITTTTIIIMPTHACQIELLQVLCHRNRHTHPTCECQIDRYYRTRQLNCIVPILQSSFCDAYLILHMHIGTYMHSYLLIGSYIYWLTSPSDNYTFFNVLSMI